MPIKQTVTAIIVMAPTPKASNIPKTLSIKPNVIMHKDIKEYLIMEIIWDIFLKNLK